MKTATDCLIFPAFVLFLCLLGCIGVEQSADSQTPDSAASAKKSSGYDSVRVVLPGRDSMSVLELTRASHSVEFRESLMGAFVLGIDSVRQSNNADWIFKVNDSMVPMASDKKFVGPTDTVVWIYRVRGD